MQNKGAIRFLAILLFLACVFQLSFTLVTKKIESNAREYGDMMAAKSTAANKDSIAEVYTDRYLDSLRSKPVYNILVKNYTYAEVKDKELNLGLDLKGGMNVTLEVSVVDLVRSMANYSQDPVFNQAIQEAQLAQRNSQQDFVTLFGDAYQRIDKNAKLAAIFSTLELKDKVNFQSTNEEVLAVIRAEANDAIDRSFNILRTRIDKFGVTQPNIQKLDVSGRILIELPGVKDKERVRKLLQGTANLEFWETYENAEVSPMLEAANKRIGQLLSGKTVTDSLSGDSTAVAKADTLAAKKDTAAIADVKKDTASGNLLSKLDDKKAGTDSLERLKLENPLYEVMQPAVYRTEKGFALNEGPVVGYVAIKDTAKVMSYLNMAQVKSLFPKNLKLLWTVKPYDPQGQFVQLVAIKVSTRDGRAPLEGNVITDAMGDFSQTSSAAEVSMSMNAEGAQTWKRLTKENIGKSIAIVLDNYVYSFPTVQSEISGGRSSITGNFTINEAKDLANILKAGKLPAPARIVEEAVVGPSLGQEAISAGVNSFVIALIVVLIFMGVYYNTAGWVADIALFVNIFFIFGVLTSLGAVLTLPGIAGIVLTIGMSVDANILIFERVREELAAGSSLKLAVKEGYSNAMSSIIDSNVTTLLLGIILFIFGTGPIQGFATTLIIGILTSMFSAIFITRLILDKMLSKGKVIPFSTAFSKNMFKNMNIDFIGKRKLYYTVTIAFVICGLISFFVKGFHLGVDFKGGRSYVVRTEKNVGTDEIRAALTPEFGSTPEVKTFGTDQFKILTTYKIEESSDVVDAEVENKLMAGLSKISGFNAELLSSQKVGPTIADDIKTAAFWSIVFALIVMFVYILIRFKKWQYSLGSVIALLHDVLFILSIYTIFNGVLPISLEIDQHFIAAILTVMGYSMNDTVVVFDRLREYLNNSKKDLTTAEKGVIINKALNSTLSRTINTSLTIFFVLLIIFIFGGEVIRSFSFALLLGIVVGTYSSICIATPVVIDFEKEKEPQLSRA